MKVILKQDIKGVGKKDQIINANDGYARNYLFPKDLAIPADKSNMNNLESKKASQAHKKELEKKRSNRNSKKNRSNIFRNTSKKWRKWKNIWFYNNKRNSPKLRKTI